MRTPSLLAAAVVWLLSAACGQIGTDPPEPTTSSTTGTPTSSTTLGTGGSGGAGAMGDAGGSGGSGGMGGATTTTTSDATGGSTTMTGGSGGGTSTGEPVLLAFHVDGMYPTVRIFKGDPVNDRCLIVRLAILGSGGADDPAFANLARPDGWGVEYVFATKGFADCHDFNLAVQNELQKASGVSGSVTWQGGWPPATLDIDATLTFAPGAPWVPAEETIAAVGLAVEPG